MSSAPRTPRPRSMSAAALGRAAAEIFGEDRVSVVPDLAEAIDRAATLAEAGEAIDVSIGAGAVLDHRLRRHRGRGPHAAEGPPVSEDVQDAAGPPANTERSPRRGMCAAVLSLEAIALGLTTPVLITIAGVDTGTALAVGLGLAVVCLLLAGMLRAEWAYLAGYVVQAAAIGLGFVDPGDVRARPRLRRALGGRRPARTQDRARAGRGLGGLAVGARLSRWLGCPHDRRPAFPRPRQARRRTPRPRRRGPAPHRGQGLHARGPRAAHRHPRAARRRTTPSTRASRSTARSSSSCSPGRSLALVIEGRALHRGLPLAGRRHRPDGRRSGHHPRRPRPRLGPGGPAEPRARLRLRGVRRPRDRDLVPRPGLSRA